MADEQMDMELGRLLGRIEGKLDELTTTLKTVIVNHGELEVRLRVLEEWRWKLVGMATILASAVSIAVKMIIDSMAR